MYRKATFLGPDLVIKLDVDASVAHARKPDHSFEKMAEKSAVVKNLQYGQCEMVEIDASRSYSEVEAEVKAAVWQHLLAGRKLGVEHTLA